MLYVYFNYPASHVSAHRDPNCGRIQPMGKPDQRVCGLNIGTITSELERFQHKHYRFQSTAGLNDMWLRLDFGDTEFELALADFVRRLLGRHYKPFREAHLQVHC